MGKDINEFFKKLGMNKENDEDCKMVVRILLRERVNLKENLAKDSGKRAQKALKFIEKYS